MLLRMSLKGMLEQIQNYFDGQRGISFEANSREEMYGWVTRKLVEQVYGPERESERGVALCVLLRASDCHSPDANSREHLPRDQAHGASLNGEVL